MRLFAQAAMIFAAAALLAGCNRNKFSVDQFVLDAASARKALETTLDSWKSGNPPRRIDSHSPPIDVFDSKWQAGTKISGFEITGEDTTPEGNHRRLTVKLTLQGGGTEEARYIVLGKNTLSVYREEDYKKLSGM